MHTEQEASTRWCPFARYAVSDQPGANRWKQSEPTPHALNPVPCRCIASQCMAWRWAATTMIAPGTGEWFDEKTGGDARGYCGLAMEAQP